MPHSPTPAARSWPHTLLRALAALTALAALVAGVPALLLMVGTLPARLPSLHEAQQLLSAPDDDGSGLVATMTVSAWVAWLWLTVPVLIELAAVLARRTTPRLPGMATGQRLAGFLLGSILLASPAVAATAATPTPPVTLSAPHSPATAAPPVTAPGAAPAVTDAAAGPAAPYTVGEGGTTWWELAEQLYGDGSRYEELRRLNPAVPATASALPAGSTVQVPAALLANTQPGATHMEPAASAHSQNRQNMNTSDGSTPYTVQPGDSLSRVAQHELGDAAQWPAVFEASKNTPQPAGLPEITDPDLIYPGQHLQVPHPPSKSSLPDREQEAPPPEPPAHSASPNAPAPPQANVAPRPPASTTPSSGAVGPGGKVPETPSPSGPSSSPRQTASTTAAPEASTPPTATSRSNELRTTLGAFALLAAAVTAALSGRRLLQRRRRRAGETIAIAEQPSPAAAQLAQLAEPDLPTRLDTALRTLAHHAHDTAQPLPELKAARLNARGIAVLPQDPQAPPVAPFTGREGDWWCLRADAELLTGDDALAVPAPYPALVTLGASNDTGALLLLNLESSRVLLLEGSDAQARQVCRALALELGMSPWSNRLEIVTVGFGEELTSLLPTARIAHKRQPEHAVRDLADWLLSAYQVPDEANQVYVLLCATTLDADTAWQLAEALDKSHGLPAVVIAPAENTSRHFAEAEILNAAPGTVQELDTIEMPVIVQRIDDGAYQQITTDLRISGQPANPAEGAWRHVPAEPASNKAKPEAVPLAARQRPPAPADEERSPAAGRGSALGAFPALVAATPDASGLRLVLPDSVREPAAAEGHTSPDRKQASPSHTDTDRDPGERAARPSAQESRFPELRVLGPVQVTGGSSTGHGPREAQLAALLHFKPGRTADTVCTDMDPLNPWSRRTLQSRLSDLRRTLGDDPDGEPYVPRRASSEDPYVISPEVRCDWDQFTRAVEQCLQEGPSAVTELEAALSLVRGKPFGANPPPWAEPYAQEMVTRIVDAAHTIATWRTAPGPHHDLTSARQAVAAGLEIDDSAELLYRDWLLVEHAAGSRSGVRTAVARLQQINRTIDACMEDATEQLLRDLLPSQVSFPGTA
ncbi:LysM peptidoglycan-binding domain-containing protein [Streptomyces sp. NPDC004528]|uniref:LysM peptidoglycan-binding domain-containing protein n=1 Tax=Streptomyces sp. NPDC004528 TaxID=3154550 RepID=UPI0033B98373